MTWQHFKEITEAKWLNKAIRPNVYGFQIQAETNWNSGMTAHEVQSFEELVGSPLPNSYKEMLQVMNGFDKDCVNVYGSDGNAWSYDRRCYKYPDDWEKTQWLRELINEESTNWWVREVLGSFNLDDILGYIPLYGHRALVVFKDASLSPVLSIVSNDVIIYGNNLKDYWQRELGISDSDV